MKAEIKDEKNGDILNQSSESVLMMISVAERRKIRAG